MDERPPLDRERYHRRLCHLSRALCPRLLPTPLRLTTFAMLKRMMGKMPDDYWRRYGDLERWASHPRYRVPPNALDIKTPFEACRYLKRQQLLTECGFAAAINITTPSTWSDDDHAHYRRYQQLVIVSCLQLHLIGDHDSAIENALREIRLIATEARHTPVLQELPDMAAHPDLATLIKTLRANRQHSLPPLIERGLGFLCVVIYDAYRLAKGVTRYRRSQKLPAAEHYVQLFQLEKTDDTDIVVEELVMHPEPNGGLVDEPPFALDTKTLRIHDPSSPHHSPFLRAELNKRVTEQLAVRQLSLPCSFEQASNWDIEHLVRGVVNDGDPVGRWLLLALVCGGIPGGLATGRSLQVIKERLCLVIEHKVPASTLDERLHAMLPPTHFRIVLPLPMVLQHLAVNAPPPSEQLLKKHLALINERHQTRLTLGRIARYLEHWYINQGIDLMQVALVRGQDYKKRPALAYSNTPTDQVTNHHRAYLQFLFNLAGLDAGLPPARSIPATVGSSLLLPGKVLHNLFNRLLIPPPAPKRDAALEEVASFHNHYLCYVWALLTFVTGHRDVTAPLGSFADYNPITRTWWISDKEIRNGLAARTLVIPVTAARQVALYQAHLHALGQRYRLLHRGLAQRCDAALDGSKNLLFFILHDSQGHLLPQDPTPSNLNQQLGNRLPIQHNWARHHLRSVLLRSELAPSVIDGWMGHEEIGESIFGRHSCLSIQTLQHVADLIEAHLNFHQIEARAGWQIL